MQRNSRMSSFQRRGSHTSPNRFSLFRGFSGKKFISVLLGSVIIGIALIWILFLRGVPSLDGLEKGSYFRESTVIYDNSGGEIYGLFKDGKRTYVAYDDISQSIKDAIISAEDRTFFENPGIDFRGLLRVSATYVTGNYGRAGGASTISQQLIKNTLLTNERSVRRKVQEAYLSYRLNNAYEKTKILEMYLNAIPFGYNANGIEQASRTFFGKSAKEVGPLGASILASLPNGPTKFSPYLHRDLLMGKLEVYPSSDPTQKKLILSTEDKKKYNDLYTAFKSYIANLTIVRSDSDVEICNVQAGAIKESAFRVNSDGCVNVKFNEVLNFFGNITIKKSMSIDGFDDLQTIEYTIGRKDFVAAQMLEDGKIDGPTFQKIVADGIDFEFKKYTENIRYPYFVMYIKEYLETKYGKDLDITNGLRVYTTIDPRLQDKAEELVRKQVAINKAQFGASSAALVSMDNTDGKLLAMVGGPDYFDTENGGNNNMTTAIRQPGSSFKPFVYALAISKQPIGPESPIADVRTKFGPWEPNNYDEKFKGIMMVKTALGYSRNIPAIKMYYLAGQENELITFGKSIGLNSLRDDYGYGAPLAIGTAEVKPIELMQGYSVLANGGIKRSVYAISKIEDSDGNIIEEHKPASNETPVLSPGAAYIVSTILANNEARPDSQFWRNALTIPGRTVAAKTGTSNKPAKKGSNTILPGDLWTAGYTPQITTVVWAGNVDGTATKGSCDGLNCAAPIWKGYMEFALRDLPKVEFKKPSDIYEYTIVKTTGKLAGENTPASMTVKTIMAVKFDKYDDGMKTERIDTLCNGPVSENTPADAISTIYIPTGSPVIDGFEPSWTSGFLGAVGDSRYGSSSASNKPCVRPDSLGNVSISTTPIMPANGDANNAKRQIIEIAYSGDRMIARMTITTADGTAIRDISYGSGAAINGKERVGVTLPPGDNVLHVTLIDTYGFKYSSNPSVLIGAANESPIQPSNPASGSNNPPELVVTNPRTNTINLYAGDLFNLRFQATIGTNAREISVFLDGKMIHTASNGSTFVIPIQSANLDTGDHSVEIKVTDGNFKTTNRSFTLTILPR